MAVEPYYFSRLNVSLWQTSHLLCTLIGFHTSLIDMHTKKPFVPDPLQLQMSLLRNHRAILFCGCDNKDREPSQLVVPFKWFHWTVATWAQIVSIL